MYKHFNISNNNNEPSVIDIFLQNKDRPTYSDQTRDILTQPETFSQS